MQMYFALTCFTLKKLDSCKWSQTKKVDLVEALLFSFEPEEKYLYRQSVWITRVVSKLRK